jgi:GNAT superfamily N-acetyltransferase
VSSTSPRSRHGAPRSRLRVAPWHGDESTSQLVPYQAGLLSVQEIAQITSDLHDSGVRRVLTPALAPGDGASFLAAGFVVHERLHLLRRDLRRPLPPSERPGTRRARRSDLDDVLRVDHAAFEPFWQLGGDGINEAVAATPQSRFRVIGRPVRGYVICGCATRRGYIQRLAVDPDRQGDGLGRRLLNDALSWLVRRRATSVLVNTQVGNDRALALYENLGFDLQPDGLSVLVHEASP